MFFLYIERKESRSSRKTLTASIPVSYKWVQSASPVGTFLLGSEEKRKQRTPVVPYKGIIWRQHTHPKAIPSSKGE